MAPRTPKAKADDPPVVGATNGASKRKFVVVVGCDWGDGYRAPGTIVDNVPADIAPTWEAEGVIVEGDKVPDGPSPIEAQSSVSVTYPETIPFATENVVTVSPSSFEDADPDVEV